MEFSNEVTIGLLWNKRKLRSMYVWYWLMKIELTKSVAWLPRPPTFQVIGTFLSTWDSIVAATSAKFKEAFPITLGDSSPSLWIQEKQQKTLIIPSDLIITKTMWIEKIILPIEYWMIHSRDHTRLSHVLMQWTGCRYCQIHRPIQQLIHLYSNIFHWFGLFEVWMMKVD